MNAALILTAIFNGAWQGALLCCAAYCGLRVQRTLNAATLFGIWSVLLTICVALPFANYAFATRPYTLHVATPVAVNIARESLARDNSPSLPESVTTQAAAAQAAPSFGERVIDVTTLLMEHAAIVLLLLAAIAALRLSFVVRDIVGMFAARRAAEPIDAPISAPLHIARPHAFVSSRALSSPCVLGFSPALIVIPQNLLNAPREELFSVILHEAEHVRRYDDVQNVLHRVLGAIAFFCPGVSIAVRQLALYREQICDDAALSDLGDPLVYARTLTGMAQWAQGAGVPVPSFIFKRKQLLHRLEAVLDGAANHSLSVNRRFAVAAGLTVLLAAGIVLRVQIPVVAKTYAASAKVAAKSDRSAAPARRSAGHHVAFTPHIARAANTERAAKRIAAVRFVAQAMHVKPTRAQSPPLLVAAERAPGDRYPTTTTSQATASAYAVSAAPPPAASVPPPGSFAHRGRHDSDDLLSALQASGMTNLSVDDLVALRDHGVRPELVSSARSFFGPSLAARTLIELADRGVDASYLHSLSAAGLRNISPAEVVRLRDHGVDAAYIVRIRSYNARAGVDDIIRLRDSGF